MTRQLRARLQDAANPSSVAILQRFFKTGPGEYAEGDVFIGVKVPALRSICRDCGSVSSSEVRDLLRSRVHEERLLALLLLVRDFRVADEAGRRQIYDLYLANTKYINNWDLVDASAPAIVGGYLEARNGAPLRRLAKSKSIWERRIAIVATQHFIRQGDFADALAIADVLLDDDHDLIHKAVGWMLREVGKRDGVALRNFLKPRCRRMPRTMLRYAIERFPDAERRRYLSGTP
jgi:3-methyladenine DNA glycosylase AlkD